MLHAKVPIHVPECKLFDVKDKIYDNKVSQKWSYTPTYFYSSAFTLGKPLSTDTSQKELNKCGLSVIVGCIALIFITIVIILDIKSVFEKTDIDEIENTKNNAGNVSHKKSSLITENTSMFRAILAIDTDCYSYKQGFEKSLFLGFCPSERWRSYML